MKIAGLMLIVLGLLGLIYGGIRYTTRDTVVDLGPIHATAERRHSLPIAPLVGVVLIGGGAALLLGSRGRGWPHLPGRLGHSRR